MSDEQITELSRLRHELRTPLNAIIGYSEMLIEEAEDENLDDLTDDLKKIHGAGRALLESVNRILDPSRFESPDQNIDVASVHEEIRRSLSAPLAEVFQCNERLLQIDASRVSESFTGDLERIRAAGDKLLAFINELSLSSESKTLLAQTILRPARRAEPTSIARVDRATVAMDAGEIGAILVVDDNEMNRDILSRYLRRQGHDVAAAAGGSEAFTLMRQRRFDLVLLDVMMDEMDGFEVIRRMKGDPALSDIPVIFISALDDTQGKVRAFKAGGVDYITKPFQAEEVVARAENQLKISRLQRELARQNQELMRRNEELMAARKRTELVFSALAEALPGTVLDDKYHLEHKIGSGGFGAVYHALHRGLNRPVAVKVFRPMHGNDSPEGLERFQREGISASRINHPNAVAILDCGISSAGIAYLVMELLEGKTLTDEMEEKERLTVARSIEIITPVCDVLAEAHRLGIIHRDIKPDNIFLHQSRDGEIVKVVDFGLAKVLDAENVDRAMTMAGKIVGTPVYTAPERFFDKPYDGRADVYSLGIVMYEMLTGRVPFQPVEGGIYAVAVMHLTKEPQPLRELNSDIPEEVEAVVMKALVKDAENRPTAEEFLALLRSLETHLS
ncbi:MAG: protein kinase [Acidobacteriota bacterium]